jgi:hypothetical protein
MVSFGIISWLDVHLLHLQIAAANIRSVSGILSLIILLAGIYKGMKDDNRIKTGIGISLITAVILSLFTFFYCTLINPGYAGFMVDQTRQSMAAAGKSSIEINSRLNSVRKEFSTGAQVMMALISQLVIGTIASCIFYYILRKHKKKP